MKLEKRPKLVSFWRKIYLKSKGNFDVKYYHWTTYREYFVHISAQHTYVKY